MFSKIFTFGLAALSFVGAAPATGFQVPMAMSCGVSFLSAAAHSIQPGLYHILPDTDTILNGTELRSYSHDDPVFVRLMLEWPGPFADWNVETAPEGAYIISNVGLNSPIHVGHDKTIIAGYKNSKAVPFAIQPAGEDTFVVKAVNEDLVWTLETPESVYSEACYQLGLSPVPHLSFLIGASPPGTRTRGAEVEIR
ncbi:hypothetical protein B0H13DRAFT_2324533 [Mycena leptocephala]|nr:hypothetical protein B0H13DRAFT_2324533 [Mycena leptocephala]